MSNFALVVLVKGDVDQVHIINKETEKDISAIRAGVKEWLKTHETEYEPGDVRIQVVEALGEPDELWGQEILVQAITEHW